MNRIFLQRNLQIQWKSFVITLITRFRSSMATMGVLGTVKFFTRGDFPQRMSQPGSYGTKLPGSPVDGELAGLVDSVINPSFQWRFRYNGVNSIMRDLRVMRVILRGNPCLLLLLLLQMLL
jgi:hypothetical protein